ncbi:MAG: Holliday junction branch migration protein RuvA, partial [Rubrivivax sp.]
AERLLLELKGRLGAELPAQAAAVDDAQGDIVQALVALGDHEREARGALKGLPAGVAVGEGIKLALKALSR